MGPARAKDLLFTGRLMPASEAQTFGLVNRLVDGDQLQQAVRELALEIAAHAPLTIRATKEIVRRLAARRRLVPGEDADMVELCYGSADFREGVNAFLQKRKPKWTGQ